MIFTDRNIASRVVPVTQGIRSTIVVQNGFD